MSRSLSLTLVALLVSSLFADPASAQLGGLEQGFIGLVQDLFNEQFDDLARTDLPVLERSVDDVLNESEDAERAAVDGVSDLVNRTLENESALEAMIREQTRPFEETAAEYQEAVERRTDTVHDAVVRNASAVRKTVNDTALVPVFDDTVELDAVPPVAGRNTGSYYTLATRESTSFTSPSITINRTTWDAYPDAWLHWALGEDPVALDRLSLPFVPPGNAERARFPGGYPGDSWHVAEDADVSRDRWTFNDPDRGVPARGLKTELVTPVIDLRGLPRVETDALDNALEEALNIDPDDLLDRVRNEGATRVRFANEAFLVLGEQEGFCTDPFDVNIFVEDESCQAAEPGSEAGIIDGRASIDVEPFVNTTADPEGVDRPRFVDRVIGLAVGPVRGPLRQAQRVVEQNIEGAYAGALEARDAVQGALDTAANPAPREPFQSEGAFAELRMRHRFTLQPRDDGANVQISAFDPTRNVWTPWLLLRPSSGPGYTLTARDASGAIVPASAKLPAVVALSDGRSAWAGEALNARGLGWTNATSGYVESTFDLSAFAGLQVRLRFYAATSSARLPPLADEGWSIDSVLVEAAGHPREAGLALQLVPAPGALVLPGESVPVETKVRNYGKTPVDATVLCLVAEAENGAEVTLPRTCGSVGVQLEPAQEQVVAFPPLSIRAGRDARITLRLAQPAGDSATVPLVTLADAEPENNELTLVFRAQAYVDHAIARVRAIPLEEIAAGIQAEGAPWRIVVTVENRGNVPLTVGPDDLNVTIEDPETGETVANLTTDSPAMRIDRGPELVGPGMPQGVNRHAFVYEWVAPLPGLYRVAAEVDAVKDRRPENDEGVAFLPVRRANTGAFEDEVEEGLRVSDRRVREGAVVSYPSKPVPIQTNKTLGDDMLDLKLVASGLWMTPPTRDGTAATNQPRWLRYSGPSSQPLVISTTDREVRFSLWGEIAQGASFAAKWCNITTGRCTSEGNARNPSEATRWTALLTLTSKAAGWAEYSATIPPGATADESKGYIAFLYTPGRDDRPLMLDEVKLPLPVRPTTIEPNSFPETVVDHGDYIVHSGTNTNLQWYKGQVLDTRLEPDAHVTAFEVLTPGLRYATTNFGKGWIVKGHVKQGNAFIVHGAPGALRSDVLPTPVEDDWHLNDASGALWWGKSGTLVRSGARPSIEFGPVDLSGVEVGKVQVEYRGWLPDANARLEWAPYPGGDFRTLFALELPKNAFTIERRSLTSLAGERVLLRVSLDVPETGTLEQVGATIKPLEIDRITFIEGKKQLATVKLNLTFNGRAGSLDEGMSFRQGGEALDEAAWYRVYGEPIAPTDAAAFFAAFPRFASQGGASVPSTQNVAKPLVRQVLCLNDIVDLSWAARPALVFDQQLYINSVSNRDFSELVNGVTATYDLGLVQVRVVGEGHQPVEAPPPVGAHDCDLPISTGASSSTSIVPDDVADEWRTVRAFKGQHLAQGWSSEAVDLQPFAGKRVQVRFVFALAQYWTQLATFGGGPNPLTGGELPSFPVETISVAGDHHTYWLVDRVRVTSPDGRAYAPFVAGDESLGWDLDGAGVHAGAQPALGHPWTTRASYEPHVARERYYSFVDDKVQTTGATLILNTAYVLAQETHWHEREVAGVGRAWAFGRDRLPGTEPALGFWAQEVVGDGCRLKLEPGCDELFKAYAPDQRLLTPVLDVANLSAPLLILRHAYNGSFLPNSTGAPAHGTCYTVFDPVTNPDPCADDWKSVAYLIEGRYQRFDDSWSAWLPVVRNFGRPDAQVINFTADSGREFPTFVTERLDLEPLLPQESTGRLQFSFQALSRYTSANGPGDTQEGFVRGGWLIDSLRVADGQVANDVAVLRARLVPAVGRVLVDDVTGDGIAERVLPPSSAIALNLTLANRGIFTQDRVAVNISWGHDLFGTEVPLASVRERGAPIRSIEVAGLPTPAVEADPSGNATLSQARRHNVNVTLELPVDDELPGDNVVRIPAVVAAIRAAEIRDAVVLPRVDDAHARRLLALRLSNDGNVALGMGGALPLPTHLFIDLTCKDAAGSESSTTFEVRDLPVVPPRGPLEGARPLPAMELPELDLPDVGSCRAKIGFFVEETRLHVNFTSFEVRPVVAGDVVTDASLDAWKRGGPHAELWNLTSSDHFSAPTAFEYELTGDTAPGQAVLETPLLPANQALGPTALVFAYNASLGVGDIARIEHQEPDGTWKRLSWTDPDRPRDKHPIREISGITGLKVVTIPNFGVKTVGAELFPPAHVPGAGALEPVTVLGYEPSVVELDPLTEAASAEAFGASDGSLVLPEAGDRMWFVDRRALAEPHPPNPGEGSSLVRKLPALAGASCLSWRWRAELVGGTPGDDVDVEYRAGPTAWVAVTLTPLEDHLKTTWRTLKVDLPATAEAVQLTFYRNAPGNSPGRGLWLDALKLNEGTCGTPGAPIHAPASGFLNGADDVEEGTCNGEDGDPYECGTGWRLVSSTASGAPFGFNLDPGGRNGGQAIGAYAREGLAPALNASLFLPLLDLTRVQGNAVLSFYAKSYLRSGEDGFWMLYSSRLPGATWTDWRFLDTGNRDPLLGPVVRSSLRGATPNCSQAGQDRCAGAFAEIPCRNGNAPPCPGSLRKAMWSGELDQWIPTTIDLSEFVGREVRFVFRLGTDAANGSPGVLIDDFSLTGLVLVGAPTKLRFVVDTAGRTPGSRLMVDHVRLLGETAETNVALKLVGLDGVDLRPPLVFEDRNALGEVTETVRGHPIQPGKVTTADVEITNAGRSPVCNLGGVVSLQRLGPQPFTYPAVGYTVPGCLGPSGVRRISVPLLRDAAGPLEVPDHDGDGDRVLASADPTEPLVRATYRLTGTLAAPDDDALPRDDTHTLTLVSRVVRQATALLPHRDVAPRLVHEGDVVNIRTQLVTESPVALLFHVQPIIVDASPSHDNGWGEGSQQNWTDPAEYTGERFGLEARTVQLIPGEEPFLHWNATNLSQELAPGLYKVVIETSIDEAGSFPFRSYRSGGVPLWIDAEPVYLRHTFEGKLVDGVASPNEWGLSTPIALHLIEGDGADIPETVSGAYTVEPEAGRVYALVTLDDLDFTGFQRFFVGLDAVEPVGRLNAPEDAVTTFLDQDGDMSAFLTRDMTWAGPNGACSSSDTPFSHWCDDTGQESDDWEAASRYDIDLRKFTLELARDLDTGDAQDAVVAPLQELGIVFSLINAAQSGSIEGQPRYSWPAGAEPFREPFTASSANADDWARLTLPDAPDAAPVGDPEERDLNPYRGETDGGPPAMPNDPDSGDYWRQENGDWRWEDGFMTYNSEICANGVDDDEDGRTDEDPGCTNEGGGRFSRVPDGGDAGENEGDGAWVYEGRQNDTGLNSADGLYSPVFHIPESQFEGAVLRFKQRYAFEGKDSGATVQMQIAKWIERAGASEGAPDGFWTFSRASWVTLGPRFEHPFERGAGGLSPDAYDEYMNEPAFPVPGTICGNQYDPTCGFGHPINGTRHWGSTYSSSGWSDVRVDLNRSRLCTAWITVGVRPCEGLERFVNDRPRYATRDLVRNVDVLQDQLQETSTTDPDEQFHHPLVPVRLRFVVGAAARDRAASASWAIDDVSVSAYDPQLSLVRTIKDPFNLTLGEGQPQLLELVVRNRAKVPDLVRLETGFRGAEAPGWTVGVLGEDDEALRLVDRELGPGEEWRVPIVIRPAVGVLAPDVQYLFRVAFTARSLLDPLAANVVTINVRHATSLHPEIITTQVAARTQGRLSGELGTGAFVGVPVTVQGTLVNLGVEDAEGVPVALEVTDPGGKTVRVPAPSGADTATVGLLTGGGGLARVAFEWRPARTGTHTLTLIADPADLFKEPNEPNNVRSITVNVQPLPLPDLAVTSIDITTPEGLPVTGDLSDGDLVHVIATVVNRGLSTAKDVRVEFRAGKELFWTEKGGRLAAIEPQARLRVLAPWKAFTSGPSDVPVTALALFTPAEGTLFDGDLADNQLQRAVVVRSPDIRLSAARVAVEARPGELLTLPLTVTNAGNAVDEIRISAAPPGPLRSAFFPAATIPLAPGHKVDGALMLAVPPLTPAGTYEVPITGASSVGQATGTERITVEVRSARAFSAIVGMPSMAPGADTLQLRLINTGNERLVGALELDLPEGWAMEGTPPSVDLAPGDAAIVTTKLTTPDPTPPGPVRLGLGIEGVPLAAVQLSVEVRAEGHVVVTLAEAVQLVAGEPNVLHLNVANIGNLPAEARLEPVLGSGLVQAEGLPVTLTLESGEERVLEVTITPEAAFSELPLSIHTAWQDEVVGLLSAADLPDLAVLGLELGSDPVAGSPVFALARVGNLGTATSPPTSVSLYMDDVLVAVGEVEGIPPGEERVARISITPATGTQGLTAIVDEADVVHEASSTNNARHVTVEAGAPGVLASLRRAVPGPTFILELIAALGAALATGRRRWGKN